MEEQEDKEIIAANERIEAFLRGQMTTGERKAFLEDLAKDESLRERAAAMALLVKSMHKIGRENDEKVMHEVKQGHAMVRRINFRVVAQRVLAVAACLCILFSVYDYHDAKVATGELAVNSLKAYTPYMPTADDLSRGPGDEALKQKEVQVLNELNGLFQSVVDGTDVKQSITSLKEKYEQANSVTVNSYTQYYKHIGYYLAVAYLKDNNRKEAKAVLTEVVQNEPDFEEAKQLLEKINKIHFIFE